MLAELICAAAVAAAAAVVVLHLPDLALIAVHLRRWRRALAAETGTAALATGDADLPTICVQLAVYDEPQVADAVASLCALDWPAGRLEIQVLDDSPPERRAITAATVAAWQARGLDVQHLWRPDRDGFKAGALAAGLARTEAEYLAIFDVDYRPGPDFLRRGLAALVAAPHAAFVQARLDYRNRDHNMLTRGQAAQLDHYFAYEQAARSWAGIPTPFNGTAAIWRRRALEQAGGWTAASLLEDLDVSLRAFAHGWSDRHLMTVSVAGELPETVAALAAQRRRWATGTGQSFRQLPWSLLRRLRPDRAGVFLLLSLQHAVAPIAVVAAWATTIACWLIEPAAARPAVVALLAAQALVVAVRSSGALLARRVVRTASGTGRGGALGDLLGFWLLEVGLVPLHVVALLDGLVLRRRLPFVRTPKKG